MAHRHRGDIVCTVAVNCSPCSTRAHFSLLSLLHKSDSLKHPLSSSAQSCVLNMCFTLFHFREWDINSNKFTLLVNRFYFILQHCFNLQCDQLEQKQK